MRLNVTTNSTREALEPLVVEQTRPGTVVNTDEWKAYNRLDQKERPRVTVNHGLHEWARDDDADGVREVHVNTAEGSWTGLRNFLRPFRGVSKIYLQQYAAIYAWGYCLKAATDAFWHALLGVFTPDTS